MSKFRTIRVQLKLKKGLAEIWDKLISLPEYASASDLFRDMIRSHAVKKKILTEDGELIE